MHPTRILIAESHVMLADALRMLFDAQADLQCVGIAADGNSAMKCALQLRPDVILLDLGLPGLDGLAAFEALQAMDAPPRALVVAARTDTGFVRAAFGLGAAGYFPKSESFSELLVAIRKIVQGRRYISNEIANLLIEEMEEIGYQAANTEIKLTGCEATILQFVGEGFTSKEIGRRLGISDGTVRKHRENLRRKLGTRNSAEMATYAIRTQSATPYRASFEIGVPMKSKAAQLGQPQCSSHIQ